jgi:hypothetical protein
VSELEVAMTPADDLERESLPVGVYRTTWGNRFFVQVRRNKTLYYLGTHETIEAAVEARDAALKVLDA